MASIPDPSFQRLISCLEEIRGKLENSKDDFRFLSSYFHSQEFKNLFKVHTSVSTKDIYRNTIERENASEMATQVLDTLGNLAQPDEEACELAQLLSNVHIQGMLSAYDRVAEIDVSQQNQESGTVIGDGGQRNENGYKGSDSDLELAVKYVRLIKSGKEPLGATVKCDEDTGDIVVARILRDGMVDRSGTLGVGDVIQEINNQSVIGKTANEVVEIMERLSGSVLFKVIPMKAVDRKSTADTKVRLRALFNYDPANDDLIPCKEAGLPLVKGDILQVVSREDPNWWQARKEDDVNNTIGLVPSKQFQEKRFLFDRLFAETENHKHSSGGVNHVKNFRWRKRKKKEHKLSDAQKDETDGDKALTYEEVTMFSPVNDKHRLVILIGVGRNELKKRLLACDNELYTTAVPHTSRRMRPYEANGREYYFVSRTTMENYAQNSKFIEYGEFRKCLYGTSVDSIKRVIRTGKMCILKVQPKAAKILRRKEYKPYFVYIKPPSLETLRSTRVTVKNKSDRRKGMRYFKDEDLHDMIKAGEVLEQEYGHVFDLTIVNDDLDNAFNQLRNALNRVATQPMWVPIEWTQ
ncbi:MAGUK p55 subfamily member 7 isoform X2 [Nematostella vectensis]|uniref:MAGUK p55 subfamily member 7 isoform X2 n=1 Tax=Nematostella vectensis TaxID=45351 RepID=UPI0020773E1B|nr:MAGUK p55 subfamily member 7 isoform X2 [Nematostella vectensis]